MNCGIVLRNVNRLILAIGFLSGGFCDLAVAQGFRGGDGRGFSPPSPEDMFRRMDRNQNGQIDPDEIPGFVRDMYVRAGVDVSQPISQQQFMQVSQRIREQFEQARANGDFPQFRRPEGGSGFGGSFGGPRPSEPERREESSDRDRRDGRRDDRDRSEDRDRRDGRDRESERRRESSSSSSSSTSAKKTAKPKTRVTRDLPDDYRDKDKNGDGQIGLYEWDRKAFAKFYELDRNGDGLLTPDELIAATKKAATPASSTGSETASTASPVDSKTPATSTTSKIDTQSSDSGSKSGSSSSPSAEASPGAKAFVGLDSDRDGKLTEDEWRRSRSSRNKFEKAGVAISFPIQQAQFVELYNKVEAQ